MADTTTIRRLLLLIAFVRGRPGARVPEAASALGVTAKEVESLVDKLALCGKPPFAPDDLIEIWIEHPDRLWVHLDQALGRPLRLSRDEGLALSVAVRAMVDPSGGPFAEAASRALSKLRSAIAARARDDAPGEAAPVERRVALEPSDRGTGDPLRALRQGLDERRVVEIDYFAASRDELSSRRVHPYGLIQRLGAWYVVAHDERRDALRIFRVARVRAARVTDERYTQPEDFDVARWLDASVPSGGDERPARIRLRGPSARRALEERGGDAEAQPDGSVLLRVEVASVEWTAAWVMSFGGAAEVVDPPELREAVAVRCREALVAYE